MKTKHIIIVVLLFLIIPVCHSQNFDAGLKLGLVASQVDGDTYGGYDKLGLDVGVYVNYYFTPRASLKLELEYIQKGSSHNPNFDIGDFDQYLLRVNYVQLPVLWHYQLTKSFSCETGLAFGVLMSYYEEKYQTQIQSNAFRKFALSYQAGFGYNIDQNWKANLRFDYSLIDIRAHDYFGSGTNVFFQWGQFSNAFVISIQYIIKHANGK